MTDSKPREKDTRPVWNPLDVDPLMTRFYNFVDGVAPSKRRAYLLGWVALAVVLCVAASIPLDSSLRWVSATIGFPAGIILFAAALAVIHTTRVGDASVFRLKETVPPSRRVVYVIIGAVILAALLFMASPWMPFGVGGAIVIIAALTAFNTLRRSPEELELARQGIPDPRELELDDDEDFETER